MAKEPKEKVKTKFHSICKGNCIEKKSRKIGKEWKRWKSTKRKPT